MKRIVILGAGTAGTIMANRLARRYWGNPDAPDVSITVVDRDDEHVYQPGLLFVPFGTYRPDKIVKPRRNFLPKRVRYVSSAIDHVAPEENRVYLEDGDPLDYDVLVVATGSRVVPEETAGLTGPGWRDKMFDFYTPVGSASLARKLRAWPGGRLVINIVELPIKCPVAPLEFAFLADWWFTEQGLRDKVESEYVTPLPGAFTKPKASSLLGDFLDKKNIKLTAEFAISAVDTA